MSEKANAALVGAYLHATVSVPHVLMFPCTAYNGKQPGDPEIAASTFVSVIHGEGLADGKPFPSVLALGTDCYNLVKTESEKTLARLERWKDVSFSTDFPK